MTERTVLSSFYSRPEAEAVSEHIKALGIEVAQVDELHVYPNPYPTRRNYPISGDIPSLANLTLGANPTSRDASILMASDPSASGMADGPDESIGRNYLLTVICDSKQIDEVVKFIKDGNGYT